MNFQLTVLDTAALILVLIHFGVPLAYYYYLKKKWLPKPWNIKVNPEYKPKVTIIVPTYNEAELIKKKLDNIYSQDYPRDKLEIIIVDSASTDKTPELVRKWVEKHADLNLKLIEEPERRGKAIALNNALKHATGDIIVITDVDAFWPTTNTLSEAVKWLSNPEIGAVSCLKKPAIQGPMGVEEGYRQYYNTLRLAESKAHSTPIFHGELAAFKKEHLEKLGGLPTDIGADDSHTATRIALMGYRAITPETIWCKELVPRKNYHNWRIRRAQHLIQHLTKTIKIKPKTPKPLKPILHIEAYLHLANPWTLPAATTLLLASTATGSILAPLILAIGTILLAYKPYRTWITTQLYLITATIRNLWTKEIVWKKQTK